MLRIETPLHAAVRPLTAFSRSSKGGRSPKVDCPKPDDAPKVVNVLTAPRKRYLISGPSPERYLILSAVRLARRDIGLAARIVRIAAQQLRTYELATNGLATAYCRGFVLARPAIARVMATRAR